MVLRPRRHVLLRCREITQCPHPKRQAMRCVFRLRRYFGVTCSRERPVAMSAYCRKIPEKSHGKSRARKPAAAAPRS